MIDIEGHVDRWQDGRLEGWACAVGGNETPLTVEIVTADGAVAATCLANSFRGDLAAAGKRGGFCGFAVALDEVAAAGPFTVRGRDAAGETAELPGGPFAFARPPRQPGDPLRNIALSDVRGARGYIDQIGADGVEGWIFDEPLFSPPLDLVLRADGEIVARGRADRWRGDLQDVRQGDGRVGFRIPLPAALYDGATHQLELLRADGERALHPALTARLADPPATIARAREPSRPPPETPIELSVVVNFYNMRREAERTLTSLSRAYQHGVEGIAYEVLAIDNGSDPPLDAGFVEGFGPEFRLFRPSRAHPSPVFALNEAARAGRGRYLALMIDGAHLLSPGAIAEAIAALRSEPDPVVGLRQWFIGGDQRWLSAAGYGPALEDIAFARIGWPECGYDIFKIGAPAFDSPNHWFDGMSETNCLFLPAARFHALGGFDEAFDVAGGGFANLDLFVRAARSDGARLIALLGEATFHQYHGGTTTNVSDEEKDERVRSYEARFETLRGNSFRHLDTPEIYLRGQVRTTAAFTARQWPNSKVGVGLTAAVRPTALASQFDEGAQRCARVAYVEAGLEAGTLWAGQPTGVAPADLIEIQQALFTARPEIVLLKDVAPGLLGFVRAILPSLGLEPHLVWITATPSGETPAGVTRVLGDIGDPAVGRQIEELVGTTERSCALLELRADEEMVDDVVRALDRYARLVAVHGYMIVLGAVFGQPDLGYSRRWITRGIQRFVADHRHFVVAHTMNAHLVTTCPGGFLRRIPNVHIDLGYDPALDDLEGV